MSNPFIGEIRMFGGSFAPVGWAFCNGQLQPISENQALFNLIGTTYGGDGQSTFGLPDLQGRVPIHVGQGPSISQNYQLGERAGAESVTLTATSTPNHNHALLASTASASNPNPTDNILAASATISPYVIDIASAQLVATAVQTAGGSQPHDNMMPYACVSFIISLFGIFPSQN